jgi:RND family efflux transporter MFP subunit
VTVAAGNKSNWKVIWGGLLVAVVAIGFTVSYLLRPEAVVTPAKLGTAVDTVPGTVTIFAEYQMELKSDANGRVKMSSLDVGRRVFRNDVLVQIDTSDVDIEIERIRNELTAAKKKTEIGSTLRAEVLNARDSLDNAERQAKVGNLSAVDLEKQRRLFQQLEQRMELEEVALKLALDNLENSLRAKQRERDKMTITAPLDGVVTAISTREGDLISSNTPIATIMTVTRTIEAKLSEENFSRIKLGQKASVRFLTFGDQPYSAVISKVLPNADAVTQRYTVFLDVAVPEGTNLVPGLTGEVSFIIGERANTIKIPRRALMNDHVYVVEGGKVALRKVQRGFDGINEVEIVSGLKGGEMVVVEQQDRFRDGDRVRLSVVETK